MSQQRMIRGSVSRKGRRFLAQLPPSMGRRSTVHDTEDEAWAWIREQHAKAELGLADRPAERGPTLGEALQIWLDSALIKESTRISYRNAFRCLADHPGMALPLRAVRPADLDRMVMETTRLNTSRMRVISQLSTFFKWAEANDYVARNPVPRSTLPKLAKQVRLTHERRPEVDRIWTPEQLVTFIEHEPDPMYRVLWMFYAATGARRGEGLGVQWEGMHEDEGWCWLGTNVTLYTIEALPKGWRRRKAYFGPSLGRAIAALRPITQPLGPWVFCKLRDRGGVARRGTPLSPSSVSFRFQRLSHELGLPRLAGPHSLRRMFGTLCEMEGFRPALRQTALGHAPDLLGRYSKATEGEMRELAERLEKVLQLASVAL